MTDVPYGQARSARERALAAENVVVMSRQSVPVPAQPLFQQKVAYGTAAP